MENIENIGNSEISFSVSGRSRDINAPIGVYLFNEFPDIPFSQIDSVFGFLEPCTMYGGRRFKGADLSSRDADWLNAQGRGMRIPMTNHFIDREEYESYAWLLDKYHKKPNSIIVVNDDLAKWIRKDFPNYELEASAIKEINSHAKLDPMLDIYDKIVLPMTAVNDLDFLDSIKEKNKIRLFGNGGCAFTCPSRICYRAVSKANKELGEKVKCSINAKERNELGDVLFYLGPLIEMGFTKFKMVRANVRPELYEKKNLTKVSKYIPGKGIAE